MKSSCSRFLPSQNLLRKNSPTRWPQTLVQNGGVSHARNPAGGFGFGTGWIAASTLAPQLDEAAIVVENTSISLFTYPHTGNLLRGSQISGELLDLFLSDDQDMSFEPGFTLNADEAPVWLEFQFTGTIIPDANTFSLESSAGTPGLTYTIEEWNWGTSTYEVIDQGSESFNEKKERKKGDAAH